MTERVPAVEYPDFDKHERRRIDFLKKNIEFLETRPANEGRKQTLINALRYGMSMLTDRSMPPMGEKRLKELRNRRDWYRTIRNKNGFQLQEMGALTWLIEKVENYEQEK